MRAIMVSVGFGDLLAVTLPRNKQHFEEVWVVTGYDDIETQQVAKAEGARVLLTDSFYHDGAAFNKWKALEWGLDIMQRLGWLCLLDADIVWPETAKVDERSLEIGKLYGCLRHMDERFALPYLLPEESMWRHLPIHRNVGEIAGFTQVFHAQDPILGDPPWHEIDWKHAGGADSFFQRKWAPENRVRLPFNVLHIGTAGLNWYGRSTRRLDGTIPPDSAEKQAKCMDIWRQRRKTGGSFEAEKIHRPIAQ